MSSHNLSVASIRLQHEVCPRPDPARHCLLHGLRQSGNKACLAPARFNQKTSQDTRKYTLTEQVGGLPSLYTWPSYGIRPGHGLGEGHSQLQAVLLTSSKQMTEL